MNDFRKKIFIGSQYCTYYLEEKQTVVAGIMRNYGYKFGEQLNDGALENIEKITRKYNTILNSVMGLLIVLYLYCFVFPYFTEISKLPFFTMVFTLATIPLVILFLLYVSANKFFEKYLSENIGQYDKVKFKPTIYNVEQKAFEKYEKTPRKSKYVLLLIMVLFLFYVLTPMVVIALNNNEKYPSALKLANLYSKIIPISADIYAQKGYAQYKQNMFKEAEQNYVLANKYSFSNAYDIDILGSKIEYLPKLNALAEFDKAINAAENDNIKWFITNEKAIYLQRNNENKKALEIYDNLINKYQTQNISGFRPEYVYYNRGEVKAKLGDIKGSKEDKDRAKRLCSDCVFELKSNLIR